MRQLKSTAIPVVVGALGIVKKEVVNRITSIPGEPNLQEIQKIVLTSTSHILRKALSIERILTVTFCFEYWTAYDC